MGGWFNRKINTVKDLSGLKMRIPGIGGKVMAKAGVNVVLLAASELYTALERGVLDALEWAGPYHDLQLGFHRAAKYYYYPGWHEPGSVIELTINKTAWNSLSPELQAIVETAAAENYITSLAEFDAKNGEALTELVEQYGVTVLPFPDDVLRKLKKYTKVVIEELAAHDPELAAVNEAFTTFAAKIGDWTVHSEQAFLTAKNIPQSNDE
jgi:TRAP-type mannitol/chloroaromatic compound transport system substrate-binding protein